MIRFILEISINKRISELTALFIVKPKIDLHFNDPDYEFMAWGDPIGDDELRERLRKNSSPEFITHNLYGHYYYIYLNKISNDLIAGNSLFSIVPMYFNCSYEKIIISENAITLGNYLGSDKISKRFILETILFNYPLFNNSFFEDIKLLPTNSAIFFSGNKFSIRKHTETVNFFAQEPIPWKEAIKSMPDRFLETVKKYFPSGYYASSLTGGFDSRTLISVGLYYNRDFSVYTFGSESSRDINVAEYISAKTNLQFIKIVLGEEYIKHESLGCGEEFILNASGTATFERAHYIYAAKRLAIDQRYIITGNFGSEIFRAAHNTGPVISENLFNLFKADSPGAAFRSVEKSKAFGCLIRDSFKDEWKSLKEDLILLPNFNHYYSGITRNKQFYIFVFEEIFRKYFGAEIINQFRYLKNRTPYLDIDFLKMIFKTELAGIHSGFFENNPIKRYKGQIFYAYVINKIYPEFGKLLTGKGYMPNDLLTFHGKVNIARGYLKNKIYKGRSDSDPNSVAKAWEINRDSWLYCPLSAKFFDINQIKVIDNREILFRALSLSCLKGMEYEA